MDIQQALAIYLGTRAERGYDLVAFEITEAEGTYYLHRDDLFPVTLGTEGEAIDALLAAAFSLRNI